MQQTPPGARYTTVAVILHWIMALGILALIGIGLTMKHGGLSRHQVFELYQLHKSIGVTILLAAFLRLGWRLTHRPPELPAAMPGYERVAAHAGHLLLYLAMFGLPLTGWALVSASVFNIPTVLFGPVPWPHLPFFSTLTDKAPVEALLKLIHGYGAFAFIALIIGHAGAALRHHFFNHDDVLTRMLPAAATPTESPRHEETSK